MTGQLVGKVATDGMLSQTKRTWSDRSQTLKRKSPILHNDVKGKSSLMVFRAGFVGVVNATDKTYRKGIRFRPPWGQFAPMGFYSISRHIQAKRLCERLSRERTYLGNALFIWPAPPQIRFCSSRTSSPIKTGMSSATIKTF